MNRGFYADPTGGEDMKCPLENTNTSPWTARRRGTTRLPGRPWLVQRGKRHQAIQGIVMHDRTFSVTLLSVRYQNLCTDQQYPEWEYQRDPEPV
jgi:hypothetical protein